MLIKFLMIIFSAIILFFGIYFTKHQKQNFLLFQAATNTQLQKTLASAGKILTITAIIVLLMGVFGNIWIILFALIIGITITMVTLFTLLPFI